MLSVFGNVRVLVSSGKCAHNPVFTLEWALWKQHHPKHCRWWLITHALERTSTWSRTGKPIHSHRHVKCTRQLVQVSWGSLNTNNSKTVNEVAIHSVSVRGKKGKVLYIRLECRNALAMCIANSVEPGIAADTDIKVAKLVFVSSKPVLSTSIFRTRSQRHSKNPLLSVSISIPSSCWQFPKWRLVDGRDLPIRSTRLGFMSRNDAI